MTGRAHFALEAPDRARPKVSVLIKSYNHAKYIGRTIESVLTQSFQDFEIVVTDDGSRDGTADVVAAFADPRISLTRLPENRGISAAMNATIARSRGHYLAILNSDDWALPDRLARQVAILDARPEIALVCGSLTYVDERGAPIAFEHPLPDLGDGSRAAWLRHFFFHGNGIAAPTVMVRRQTYEDVGPYDPRLFSAQDFDMWVRMAGAGFRFVQLDQPLTAFRWRDNEMNASCGTRPDVTLREAFEIRKILERFLALPSADLAQVFDLDGVEPDRIPLRIADAALRCDTAAHRAFAVDCYFAHARRPLDLHRLVMLTGSIDVSGVRERPVATEPPREAAPRQSLWRAIKSRIGSPKDRRSALRSALET